jgi:glycosyltransferase involved in cell wall biosynthesis
VSLLTQHIHPLPVCIVGAEAAVAEAKIPIRTDIKLAIDRVTVALKGPQTEAQLRTLYSRASIYAATSRYEAFGMAPLEAAFSRCAIVANDIPCFREIWGDAAIYFQANDASSLADVIRRMHEHRDLCRGYATRAYQRARECFTAKRMIDEYVKLYHSLVGAKLAVA